MSSIELQQQTDRLDVALAIKNNEVKTLLNYKVLLLYARIMRLLNFSASF